MRTGKIYLLRNVVNHKVYVGQTWNDPEVRWAQGYREGTAIHRALCKWTWDYFDKLIIPNVYLTQSDLDDAERFYISVFDSVRWGYNSTSGGTSGYEFSKEVCDRISCARKGKKYSFRPKCRDDVKEKIRQGNLGKRLSDSTKAKMSAVKKHQEYRRGLMWFNNGIVNRQFFEPQDGWVRGMLPRANK